MWVRLPKPGTRDAHELRLLERFDRRRAAVAHRLAHTTDELVDHDCDGALVRDTALDALGHELVDILDIARFRTPTKLIGYTGLTPKVEQSGESDRRGPLRKNGPNHLRWALIEAAHTASRHPLYQPTLERNRDRHGRKRGSKLAALTIARKLTEAIWHMLTNNQPFAPAGARTSLAA